jgi:hypothetical protein
MSVKGGARKILGLDRFGLALSTIRKLGSRPVHVGILQRGIPLSRLTQLRPSERVKRESRHLRDGLALLQRRWPKAGITARGDGRLPWNLDAVLPATEVHRLARARGIAYLNIQRVKGLKERKASWERRHLSWFCVRGTVAIQIEGRARGLVTVEDRFVLVKAYDEKDATRRLEKNWRQYAEPAMNSSGELFRWQLLKVSDVYDLGEEDIDPKGTEVYSRLEFKRMKPEYAWRV